MSRGVVLMKTPLKKTVRKKKNAHISTFVTSPNWENTLVISSLVAYQLIFLTKRVLLLTLLVVGRSLEATFIANLLFAAEMVSLGVAAREASSSSLRATCDVGTDRDAESDTFSGTILVNREPMLLVAGSAA
jgi:hypothetical protein